MIAYERTTLANGLTVAVNRDRASKLAAVNILYKVGARNENPARTGFAHLFEHLMFRGTREVPNFDLPVQMASGDNNAFTNNDYTDFYITLPKDNLETALWLESDRMEGLEITPDSLRKLRWLTPDSLAAAGIARDWAVHVPVEAVSGRFGTVSAHAAVIVTLAVLSASVIRRRWFTGLMVFSSVLICYSRIYLGKHYPMDLVWGTAVGIVLGLAAFWAYRKLSFKKKS